MAELTPEQRAAFEDAFAPEDLDPELVPYLTDSGMLGAVLKHPLVFQVPYFDGLNKQSNAALRYKKAAIEEAVREGKWETYVWLHERPYRSEALLQVMGWVDDEAIWWELVRSFWSDSENIWQWGTDLHRILDGPSGDPTNRRAHIMEPDDLAALDAMAEEFIVYRGALRGLNERGWSWTIDQDKAKWFARRFADYKGEAVIVTGMVKREDVIAYFTDRGESEIVVDLDDVQVFGTLGLVKAT